MSTESAESRRQTRFPGPGPERLQRPQTPDNLQDEKKPGNRGTRFPGSLGYDFTLKTDAKLEEPAPERRGSRPTLPHIPLTVNIGNATPRRSIAIDHVGPSLSPTI